MVFNFGPFELVLSTCELKRDGQVVPLQPRMFGVLRYLIEHHERVVTKQELLDALWGGYQLNAVAVPWTINRLRNALGASQHDVTYIETVRGHGYRFVGSVRARIISSVLPTAPSEAQPAEPAQLPAAKRLFVGRTAVLTQLNQLLDAARGGDGSLCLLTGEAGIGKTSLAQELAARAEQRGVPVWLGRCFEQGSAPALWPFVQVLRAAHDDVSLPETERREARQLLEHFEQQHALDASSALQSGTLNGERFWLLDRLCRWACRSARSQARLIVIDDLQAADESSLQALSLIAPQLVQARLLVLATVRVEGAQGRASSSIAARLRPCTQVRLQGLSPAEAREYLVHVLGEELAERFCTGLWESSRGNPLFLGELSRVIVEQAERGYVADLEQLPLPAALRDVIASRLDDLPSEVRQLLEVASVIGERIVPAVLRRASGMSEETMLASLHSACEAALLAPQPRAAHYTFVHPLLREVLYTSIPADARANLHGRVGEALEALRVLDPAWRELAYHFHHAPLAAYCVRAARYGRMAGDAALQAFAYEEAVQCYGWALDAHVHAAPDDIEGACQLILIRAGALALSGEDRAAQVACKRAVELASAASLPHILVAAGQQLRPSVWNAYAPNASALQALERALGLLPESALALRARAYAVLAVLPPYSLRIDSSRAMSARALELAAQCEDKGLQLEAERSQLFALCEPGSIDTLLRVSDSIVNHCDDSTWTFCADALFARYHALMQRGDSAAAELALARYAELSKSRRLRIGAWHVERLRAQRQLHAGHLEVAAQRFEELAEQGRRANVPHWEAFYHAQRAALWRVRKGKRRTPVPANTVPGPHWLEQLPSKRARRVQYALQQSELALAKHELGVLAEDRFAAVTGDPFGLSTLVQLVAPAIRLDEAEHARTLLELLQPHSELIALSPFTFSYGAVSHYLGRLCAFLGRRREAREYLERAITINARTGHELDRLRSCLTLAELLAEQRGTAGRAQALAEEVRAAAEQLGARPLMRGAKRLLSRMPEASTESQRPAPRRRSLRAAP